MCCPSRYVDLLSRTGAFNGKQETPQSIQPHSDLNCYLLLPLLSLSLILVIMIISLRLKTFSWFWRFYFRGTVLSDWMSLFYCISMYLEAFLCFLKRYVQLRQNVPCFTSWCSAITSSSSVGTQCLHPNQCDKTG